MPVFLAPDEFNKYRDLLNEAAVSTACSVHAYVLMTNHVHLLVSPSEAPAPARLMKKLSQSYARWFNHRHGRTGTLWEGRFRSAAIDSERYLLACSRYIELNPVRARMVERPENYEWSSYHRNAAGVDDALLTSHRCYAALGVTANERQDAYRALFDDSLDEGVLAALRRGTHTRTVAGGAKFVAAIADEHGRRLPPQEHGGDRRSLRFGSERTAPQR